MKSDPEVIRILNDLLTNELTAINQYFIHAKLCGHWGFKKLAEKIYDCTATNGPGCRVRSR